MSGRTRPAPPTETGLAEGAPTRALTSVKHPTTAADSSASPHRIVPLPIRWAKNLIDAAPGPIPEYGSREWADLDDGPLKVASCVLSAERWRTRHHQPEYLRSRGNRRSREIAEARRPRPEDHPGGPVSWDEVAAGE